MGAWTKLDAVNRVLRGAGENPVSTLASTSGDALMAEQIINEVNLEWQMNGLFCNTEDVELEPDSNDQIAVDDNALHVQIIDTSAGINPVDGRLVTPRGRTPTLLYDLANNTHTFAGNLTARITYGLEYEALPFPQQVVIADESARRYQMVAVGDSGMNSTLREIWLQSRTNARAADIRQRAANIFGNWGSDRAYRAARRTPRRRW